MARVPTTTIRTDPDVKDWANEVFDGLGLSLSAAVNVFLKAVVCEGGMPFDVKIWVCKINGWNLIARFLPCQPVIYQLPTVYFTYPTFLFNSRNESLADNLS